MKQIKEQSFEILVQGDGQNGIEKMIEQAGRTAYKSEDGITADSSKKFYENMKKSKHFATFEFGAVYLQVPKDYGDPNIIPMIQFLLANKFSRYMEDGEFYYITTNERVIVENHIEDMKMFMCQRNEPTIYHPRRIVVKIQTCRQVTHETVRHRGESGNSFLQESTRFCLYLKGKYGAELTFIKPTWLDDEVNCAKPEDTRNVFRRYWDKFRFWLAGVPDYQSMSNAELYEEALKSCEFFYMGLANRGWKAQQCAMLVPNAIKADICVDMFDCDWEHFFDLRTSYIHATGMPHPMMSDIADKIYDAFVEKGLIKARVKKDE